VRALFRRPVRKALLNQGPAESGLGKSLK